MLAAIELALTLATAPAPPAAPAPAGALRGTLVDEVDFLPRQGIALILECECEAEPRSATSGDDGTFAFEGLDPGQYRLTVYGGDEAIEYTYAVAPDQDRSLVLAVPPQRLPERDGKGLPVYSGYSRDRRLLAAQVELSVGGVLLAGGAMMIVGAAVEGSKRACPSGSDTCGAPPRPGAVRGLALAGGLSAAAGGVLVVLGAVHKRQYRLGLSAGRDGGSFLITGRF